VHVRPSDGDIARVQDANAYLADKGWQLKASMGYKDMAEAYARDIPWNTDLSVGGNAFKADDYTSYVEAFAIRQ